MVVAPPRKKTADDSCYKTLVVLSIVVLLFAVIALSANSIVLSVKVRDLKAEIDLVNEGRSIEAPELENSTPGLSRQILDAIISEADQISDSAYPQTNSSIETLFQQLLQSIPDVDSMKEDGFSPELHSQQKRSISPDLALSLNSCFEVVKNLQLLTNGQVKLINILSGQFLLDVAEINNRTLRLTDDVQQVNITLQQLLEQQDMTSSDIQQINASFSQQLLEAREAISSLNNTGMQVVADGQQQLDSINASLSQQLLQAREDISDVESDIQQVNASLSQQLCDKISDVQGDIQQVNASLSQQLLLSLEAISSLNNTGMQIVADGQQQLDSINASLSQQLLQVRDDISDVESDIQQVNTSLSQQLCDKISDVEEDLQQINASLSQQLMDVEEDIQQINASGRSPAFPASSCADLLESLPSGNYYVQNSNGDAVRVFCDMTLSCGNITGGWQRVIDLDFTNRNDPCPGGFSERTVSSVRTCEQSNNGQGCTPVAELATSGVNYSRVCGKVIGYQDSTPDAFDSPNLDVPYLDGVSLTHGSGPRTHIWSFAAGVSEGSTSDSGCPCVQGNGEDPPTTVGNNYFCESAAEGVIRNTLFVNDPLWDGQDCPGIEDPCCALNTPPWFFRELESTIDDPIEMRVCRNQGANDEGTPLGSVEIYIRP